MSRFMFVDNVDFDSEKLYVASWNVNSLACRLDPVLEWIKKFKPLVLTLQEVRCHPSKIYKYAFIELGYNLICHSKDGRNGVAIVYRDIKREDFSTELLSTTYDLKNQPLWQGEIEPRALSIKLKVTKGLKNKIFHFYSLYIPNGRTLDDPHFSYKLLFLDSLKDDIQGKENLILTGDFNIAPRDEDVWNIRAFNGCTHVTPAERFKLESLKLRDVIPSCEGNPFTYWGYIGGLFWKDKGMRIDLILTNSKYVTTSFVDKEPRKQKKCSDHTPLICYIDLSQ